MKKYKQSLDHYLPREPRNIGERNWFYIEPKGIGFVHQVYLSGMFLQVDQFTIPWRHIEKALADFRAAKEKQKTARKNLKRN